MSRELSHHFSQQKSKKEFVLSSEEWESVKKDIADLHFQVQKAQSGFILVQSKIVKLFDTLQSQVIHLKQDQVQWKQEQELQIQKIKECMNSKDEQRDYLVSRKVQDLMDQYHKLRKQHSHQVQDLCQSLTHQSEQVWSLADQVQEIKEELSQS